MAFRYPINVEVGGRRCVVVGGGPAAEQRVQGLLDAGADVVVVAERCTNAIAALADDGAIVLRRRTYVLGDLEGAFVAVAAGTRSQNAEVFDEAERRGVLLNAVDDPEHCHFSVPSIVRRHDLLVTVSTGGKAPALSKRLRTELAARYGPEFGALVELLAEARQQSLPARGNDFDAWANRWQQAMNFDLVGLVRAGRDREASEIVRSCLDGGPPLTSPPRGRVALVGAGPGDPGLITVRGRELLDDAEVVVYDRLAPSALVEGRPAIFVGKKPGHHAMPQEEISALLVRLGQQGLRVVRLKGGDPFVFGRGGEEAEALARAGIDFEIVPGPSSAIAALAYAGIPVTDRRHSSSVAVVTGHCGGDREVDWRRLATAVDTIVVLMGVARLAEIAKLLIEGGRDGSTPAAVVERGTTSDQRVVTATLRDLADACDLACVDPPAVIVVGEVVNLRRSLAWFDDLARDGEVHPTTAGARGTAGATAVPA